MSLPQLLAMIQQSQGAGGAGGGMPMAAPTGASPMSSYIGAPQGGAMMAHPAMAPVTNPQPPSPFGTATGTAAGTANPLMTLIAQLKAGQTGVQPGQGGVPASAGQQTPAIGTAPPGQMIPTPAVQPGMPSATPLAQGGGMNPGLLQWLHGLLNSGQMPAAGQQPMQQPPMVSGGG